jgi:hypothetical protein
MPETQVSIPTGTNNIELLPGDAALVFRADGETEVWHRDSPDEEDGAAKGLAMALAEAIQIPDLLRRIIGTVMWKLEEEGEG